MRPYRLHKGIVDLILLTPHIAKILAFLCHVRSNTSDIVPLTVDLVPQLLKFFIGRLTCAPIVRVSRLGRMGGYRVGLTKQTSLGLGMSTRNTTLR